MFMADEDMTNREMFDLLMGEVGSMYSELKEDILEIKKDVKELQGDVKELKGDMSLQRLKTDQNFLTFMNHVESYDRRLTALEQ